MPDSNHPDAARERWTRNALYFEYSKAANPRAEGLISDIPFADFAARLHQEGPTRVIPFDMSEQLGCDGPATNPTLCANFVRIRAGESIRTEANATSQIFHVIRGRGATEIGGDRLRWTSRDTFTLPAGSRVTHHAEEDAAFYWVHDQPLLTYLGVRADTPRFAPTLYPHAREEAELEQVAASPQASQMNRVSILMANEKFPQTRTITHVIWAMFGVLPAGSVQAPHRHESIALDFIIDCPPGCYTLIGKEIGDDGTIRDPHRADWHSGSAFITPPGLWHSHHNESGGDAHLLPIQDAGLHTYLRTLDIHFVHRGSEVYISQK